MIAQRADAGFTAVELLVTLFVAAAFLIAGYQLFSVVVRDGGATRSESKASNVAYDYLRQYETLATTPCTARSPLMNSPVTIEGVVDAVATVNITCPNSSTPDMSKIEVIVQYNNPREQVKHATFTNGSGTTTSVSNGLVGWWRLNGNANDSSTNGLNGSVTGASLTTGKSGSSNNAYSFPGSGAYINLGNSASFNQTELTMSAWVRPNAFSGDHTIMAKESDYKYRMTSSSVMVLAGANVGWTHTPSCGYSFSTSTWYFIVMTMSSTSGRIKMYVNGTEICDQAGPSKATYSNNPLIIGSYNTSGNEGFNGVIDDARFYNRAISAGEVSQLYAENAQ